MLLLFIVTLGLDATIDKDDMLDADASVMATCGGVGTAVSENDTEGGCGVRCEGGGAGDPL